MIKYTKRCDKAKKVWKTTIRQLVKRDGLIPTIHLYFKAESTLKNRLGS